MARRRKRGTIVLAALAGGVVVAGTGGVAAAELGSAAPRPAATAKIYACYSDSTDALSHLDYPTVKTCSSGETMLTWNITGASGAQGAKGAPGPQGHTGNAGKTGAGGATGPQGAAGARGRAGPAGRRGAQGTTGAVGLKGPSGAQGPQGTLGAPGAKGVQGPSGSRGAQGPPGPQGRVGSVGPDPLARELNDMNFQDAVKLASYDAGGTIVDTVGVSSSGYYQVFANADLTQYRLSGACKIRVVSPSGYERSTPYAYTTMGSPGGGLGSGTVEQDGQFIAFFRSEIEQVCYRASRSESSQFVSAYGGAELTAMLVTSAFNSNGVRHQPGFSAVPPRESREATVRAQPTNRFANPFAGRRYRHGRHE